MKFVSEEELSGRLKQFSIDPTTLGKIDELNQHLHYEVTPYEDVFPNIFVFGIQRSGTTLLSQVLAAQTSLGYINNLIARFWENPQYGVYLTKHLNLDREISFNSLHGTTSNLSDVHEFGYFWSSLLQHKSSPDLGENDVNSIDWDLLKNKILSINHAYQKPCVFKNTLLGHYLSNLQGLFASPLFIYLKRDYLDIAYSILNVRKERFGSIEAWWSMKPYEYDKIKDLEPHEQIVAQIYFLKKDLDKQIALLPEANYLEIAYQDLCEDPNQVMQLIKEKVKGIGYDLKIEHKDFDLKYASIEQTNTDIKQLEHYISKYFG